MGPLGLVKCLSYYWLGLMIAAFVLAAFEVALTMVFERVSPELADQLKMLGQPSKASTQSQKASGSYLTEEEERLVEKHFGRSVLLEVSSRQKAARQRVG